MGNIGEIVSLMHKFTPKGRDMAMKILRRDRALLDEPYAFLELPQRLAKNGELGSLEREMHGNSYLAENLYEVWTRNVSHLNSDTDFMARFQKTINQAKKIQRHNQVKLIRKNKEKIAEFIEQECKNTKLAEEMRRCRSEQDMQVCFQKLFLHYLVPGFDMQTYVQMINGKNLEYFQEGYKQLLIRGDLNLKFWKMFLPAPKDKRVVEIAEILKNEYGMKYVYLETAQDAEKILKAVEFAKNKNIPLPDNIIATSAYPMVGQNILTSNLEHTVFINFQSETSIAKSLAEKNPQNDYDNIIAKELFGRLNIFLSTPDELHTVIHEFEHSRNFMFSNIKIPQKHIPAVEGLMNYAGKSFNNANDEIRTELLTKRDIMGLNKQEEQLLSLWG